jgi:hypothetical protein
MIDYVNIIKTFLPHEAIILELQHPQKRPAILVTDIDGDNIEELIGAYTYKEQNYLIGLKIMNNQWHFFIHIRGNGYGVTDLMAVPITDNRTNTLIVGWQIGSLWSELHLLKWMNNGFVRLIKSSIIYSKLEVEDMPGKYGQDGLYEFAIWTHDKSEAYNINVYRFSKGKLVQAKDVYSYYFKKVEAYYKKLLQTNDYSYYWYYLADAQKKTANLEQSLDSIEKILSSPSPYPSRQKLIDIKQQILSRLRDTRSKNQIVIDQKRGNVTGQGFIDTIYLTGEKIEGSPFWQNITLEISNEKAHMLEKIALKENSGYNPTIFLGDFTGDQLEDILVVIDTGGSGGTIYAYIFSFLEGNMLQIFGAEEYSERTKYDVQFQNQYKAKVTSSIPKRMYLLDLLYKGKEYLAEIYNEDGTLKQPITGWVDSIGGLYPIDFEREGTYELIAFQEIAGRYHADGLGYVENVLKWNGHEFVSDRKSISIFGEDLPPGK